MADLDPESTSGTLYFTIVQKSQNIHLNYSKLDLDLEYVFLYPDRPLTRTVH